MKTTSAKQDKYNANYQRTDFIGGNMRLYMCLTCGAVVPVFLAWPSTETLMHDYAIYLHDKSHGKETKYDDN